MSETIWDKQPIYKHDGPMGTDTFGAVDRLRWLRVVNGGRCEEFCFLAAMVEVDLEGKGYKWVARELVLGYRSLCLSWTMTRDKRMCPEWDTILRYDDWEKWVGREGKNIKRLRQPYASFVRRYKPDPIDAWRYLVDWMEKRMLVKRNFYEQHALSTPENFTGIKQSTFEKFLKVFDKEAQLIENVRKQLDKAALRDVDRQERAKAWHTEHEDELEKRRQTRQVEKQVEREKKKRAWRKQHALDLEQRRGRRRGGQRFIIDPDEEDDHGE